MRGIPPGRKGTRPKQRPKDGKTAVALQKEKDKLAGEKGQPEKQVKEKDDELQLAEERFLNAVLEGETGMKGKVKVAWEKAFPDDP